MNYLTVRNWDKWQSYRRDRQQPPWIKLHRELLRNAEWIALTDAQRGHLISIWMLAADKNGRIPDDAAVVRKMCCLDNEPDLNLFIDLGFLDARVTPRRRQHMTPARRQPDAKVAPQISETETETETETNKRQNNNSALTREFAETFWPVYPRKQAKPAALRAFKKARKATSLQTIMDGVRRLSEEGREKRFIPHASKWLNNEQWNDELMPRQNGTGPPKKRSPSLDYLDKKLAETEHHEPTDDAIDGEFERIG